jgi:hypothetical protein
MNRTTWLQDRRMQKFRDALSRWERKELSAMEAGALLGCSERQFRAIGSVTRRKALKGWWIGVWARLRRSGYASPDRFRPKRTTTIPKATDTDDEFGRQAHGLVAHAQERVLSYQPSRAP